MRRPLAIALLAVLAACSRARRADPAPPAASGSASIASASLPASGPIAPGLRIETAGTVTLARIDPARYGLRLLNAAKEGRARKAPDWAKEFGLVAVVNASMYEPSGLSVGLMINGAHTNQTHDLPKMGGYFAFDPTRPGLPDVAAIGKDCPGFDLARLRADYRVVFQNYRLLDCDGHALPWKESKLFSAAAIGLGKDGHVVFAHSRAPYVMTDFAKILAAPELELAQMFYVEGGPEASLYVHAGDVTFRGIGSFETGFFRDDSNQDFWELPNVVGAFQRD